ncbi:MAG: regulatory protein RecX [bacterium]|nr:regulatory protein RecX [bacterium]
MKDTAYEAALRILVRRPHSEGELAQKLKRKSFDDDEIAATLDQLRADRHLDDSRLARDFVQYHLDYKPMGKRGIARRMYLKKFTQADIDQALVVVDQQVEQRLAEQLARRKLATTALQNTSPERQREKVVRFLLSRGFSNDTVGSLLDRFETIAD